MEKGDGIEGSGVKREDYIQSPYCPQILSEDCTAKTSSCLFTVIHVNLLILMCFITESLWFMHNQEESHLIPGMLLVGWNSQFFWVLCSNVRQRWRKHQYSVLSFLLYASFFLFSFISASEIVIQLIWQFLGENLFSR